MYNQEYACIYDLLHDDKAYAKEVDFIYRMYFKYTDLELKDILDVGCGTGNHLKFMSEKSDEIRILGIDPSPAMIYVARQKEINNTEFIVGELSKMNLIKCYELGISLFNVVNHINKLKDLKSFFRSIYYRVEYGGIYIFDCLNGVAATIDAPRDREFVKEIGDEKFTISSKCENNLFNSQFTMQNKMQLGDEVVEYSLEQTLWQPKVIIDLLEDIGFEICKICKAFDETKEATKEDYKISFVVKKPNIIS